MKCTKCNFVSFDYLSECKKCGTPLSVTRDGLGFSSVKPAVNFFLGPLVKDYDPQMQAAVTATSAGQGVAEASLPSLDIGEIEMAGFASETGDFAPDFEPAGPAAGAVERDDLNLLEISDDELELMMDDSSAEGKPTTQFAQAAPPTVESAGLELEIDSAPEAPTRIREVEAGRASGPAPAAPEMAAKADTAPKFDDASLSGLSMDSEPAAEPKPETATKAASLDDENLQIELSDQDLEALLSELEDTADKPVRK